MNQTEVNQFKKLYERHLRLLKLQGKSQKTIDAYSRAVRRISEHFDCCPDKLTPQQFPTQGIHKQIFSLASELPVNLYKKILQKAKINHKCRRKCPLGLVET